MNNYLYEITTYNSRWCGERFFIQCDTMEEAEKILAKEFFGEQTEYLGTYDDDEAEMLGYDTF